MNIKNEQELFDRYPEIFRQKDLPMSQTCMCWGIDTGPGWYDLIDRLCHDLMSIAQEGGFQIEAVQVKEKFGELRFYYDLKVSGEHDQVFWDYWHERIHNRIVQAEKESGNICEDCGEPGSSSNNDRGWITTLCNSCRDNRKSR